MTKLVFSIPIMELCGKTTKMSICATLCYNNIAFKAKTFKSSITLKEGDTYNLQVAKNILQTLCENKAYIWAKEIAKKVIPDEQKIVNDFIDFRNKCDEIIKHNVDYLVNI